MRSALTYSVRPTSRIGLRKRKQDRVPTYNTVLNTRPTHISRSRNGYPHLFQLPPNPDIRILKSTGVRIQYLADSLVDAEINTHMHTHTQS